MILNPGKCFYMLVGSHAQTDYISLNDIETKSSRNETLLGVILDNSLEFDFQIKSLCRNPAVNYIFKVNNRNTRTRCEICSKLLPTDKVAQKLSDLYQINKYLSYDQFQYSQFNYYSF